MGDSLFVSVIKGLPQAARRVFTGMGEQLIQGAKTVPAVAQAVAQAPFAVGTTLKDAPRQFRGFINKTPAEPSEAYKLPLVGEVVPYGRRFLNYQQEPGYTPGIAALRAASEGVMDAAILGQGARYAGQKASEYLAKSDPHFATAQPQSVNTEINNHLASLKQMTEGKTVTPSYLESAKRNIVDGIKGRYPEVSKAINAIKPMTVDDFTSQIDDVVKDYQIKSLLKDPSSIKLFRGENAGNAGGTHFSTDPGWTKSFGPNQYELTLPKNAKVYQFTAKDLQEAYQKGFKTEAQTFQAIFDKGYDAIIGVDALNSAKPDIIVNQAMRGLAKTPTIPSVPNRFDPPAGPAVQSFLKTSLKNFKESGGGLSTKRVGAGPDVPFQGYEDLSTKLLEKLKGRTTVSRQYIEDLSNSPDLKQAERDLIRNVLKDEGKDISVPDFANRVKSELLPLKAGVKSTNYEGFVLPDELRGNVDKYYSRTWESPIRTAGGSYHEGLGGSPNYFSHTRIEDLPDKSTRRIVEVQSDLAQKGRLDNYEEASVSKVDLTNPDRPSVLEKRYKDTEGNYITEKEYQKLQSYNDSGGIAARLRTIREEVKQAAIDGKTKLQFPTGETAMKIEGLGEVDTWQIGTGNNRITLNADMLNPKMVGQTVRPTSQAGDDWIITDVLGDGKFKAVPKDKISSASTKEDLFRNLTDKKDDPAFYRGDKTLEKAIDDIEYNDASPEELYSKYDFADLSNRFQKAELADLRTSNLAETFDISGKVDTENPIYKFYEKEVGKYLKNKYGATRIKDPQGVEWYEVNITPEFKKLPIEAFGAGALPFLQPMPQSTDSKRGRVFTSPNQDLFLNK